MSRAFTKEDDAGEDLPELPVPAGPNYVTPRGLELLHAAVRELAERKKQAREAGEKARIDRDLRYLEARINTATVVPPGSGAEARFGARVTIEDEGGQKKTFRIVGEDEARTDAALLAWSAPLVSEVFGAKAGDAFTWESPEGRIRYKILSVDY
jgi:transcription elongation factor GreB